MEVFWAVFTFAAVWSQAFATCPKPDKGQYYQLGRWCYIARGLTEDTRETFQGADDACKQLDPQNQTSSLAVVEGFNIQVLLTSMLSSVFEGNAWIGLSQGVWTSEPTWVDGTDPPIFNWASDQPSGPIAIPGYGKDCVEMVNDIKRPGLWYDVPCSKKNAYFCQVQAIDNEINLPTAECEIPGYVNFFSSCFRVYSNHSTIDEAQEICARDSSVDGFLATIDNSYENAFLGYLLNVFRQSGAWIGLHQESIKDPFTWADDYPVQFTRWEKYMPNSYRGQRSCTFMYGFLKGWRTAECESKLPFICKMRLRGHHPPPTTPPVVNGSCPEGWHKSDSNCYLFKPATVQLTHDQAQYDCFLNYGARLASIHSASQNELIKMKKGNSPVWIGLEKDAYGYFQWEDGSPVDYEVWDTNQTAISGQAKCVLMNGRDSDGSWRLEFCKERASYVCVMPQYPEENPPLETRCPGSDGWLISSNYCYLFSDRDKQGLKSWREAEAWCNTNAGYLASLTTQEEQNLISKVNLHVSPRYWIGLRETSKNQTYQWSDDSDFDFTFWEEGQPNDFAGEQMCVELDMASGGKWKNKNCGLRQNFICKKEWNATSPIITPTDTPISGGCPEGWVQAKTKCFKVYSGNENRKTRMEAAAECSKYEDGHLAVIANKGEQAILNSFVEPWKKVSMWVGLSNIGSEDYQYHWSDGSTLDYTNWDDSPTAQHFYDTYCAQNIHTTGRSTWKTFDCSMETEFACSKPASPADTPKLGYLHTCQNTNYIQFNDSCYRLDTKPRTFDEAAKFCSEDGSTLATIRDPYDGILGEGLLYLHDVKETWIGLRKNKETDAFGWLDDWPIEFTAWGTNQPGGANVAGHQCAALDEDAYWFDAPCGTLRPTLCKYTSAPPPTTVAPTTTGWCDIGWIAWGSHCYKFLTLTDSWSGAAGYCSAYDALMSVHSKAENAFITTQAKAKWGARGRMWLGLTRNTDGFLYWDSSYVYNTLSEFVDYVNWDLGEVLEKETGSCAVLLLSGNGGVWRLSDCEDEVYRFCKKKQSLAPPPSTPTNGGLSLVASLGIGVGVLVGGLTLVVVLVGCLHMAVDRWKNRASCSHQDTSPIVGKENYFES